MKQWFLTWGRSEYKEWATKKPYGYLLVIIRKEQKRYLCVKAKLAMKPTGLPAFQATEEHYFSTRKGAEKQIDVWKRG